MEVNQKLNAYFLRLFETEANVEKNTNERRLGLADDGAAVQVRHDLEYLSALDPLPDLLEGCQIHQEVQEVGHYFFYRIIAVAFGVDLAQNVFVVELVVLLFYVFNHLSEVIVLVQS